MNKYLIITGGSRGIGEQTAAVFQEFGYKVICISRSDCALPNITNFNIDLSKPDEVELNASPLQHAVKDASTICLVHNAAHFKQDYIDSLDLIDLQTTLQVNVLSSISLNKIFIPLMPEGSGIFYLGSALSEKGVPGSASYIISKHAVLGLMRATCQDLAGRKIRSLCINPGLVDTHLLKIALSEESVNHLVKNKIIGNRLIEPLEIAKLIYFCATTPVLNGIVLNANLGQIGD